MTPVVFSGAVNLATEAQISFSNFWVHRHSGQCNLFKSIILSVYFIFAYYRLVRNSINHNPCVILWCAQHHICMSEAIYGEGKGDQMDLLHECEKQKEESNKHDIDFHEDEMGFYRLDFSRFVDD